MSISADLDLSTLLTHITEAAVDLVDARYGALGVLDETLPDLGEHPDSYGFPPHHPAMRSFLGGTR